MFFAEFLKRRGVVTIEQLLGICACICAGSTILLFPLGPALVGGRNAALLVLFADAIIFSTGYMANGIADGVGIRSSMPGTWCSQENYWISQSFFQNCISRCIGPFMAQTVFVSSGRASYATIQLIVSTGGLLTCCKIIRQLSKSREVMRATEK
jgi:hypothetical protein